MFNEEITYIFPFVDPTDPHWIVEYTETMNTPNYVQQRHRDLGMLKYVFRGLAENMPWVKIGIILNYPSQVPKWLNTDLVRPIYLDEFIPEKYLPCFNSTTIEMYLSRIKGLTEYLIYGNDDFFPMLPSSPSDYFTPSGLPKVSFSKSTSVKSSYKKHCKRIFDTVKESFPEINIPKGVYYRQKHFAQPMRLSTMKKVYNMYKNKIDRSITTIRTLSVNFAQNIYYDYALLARECEKVEPIGKFMDFKTSTAEDICNYIENPDKAWFCLNDNEYTKLSDIPKIISAFEAKFPEKCIYEL